jgi:hypothetical protein
MVAERRERYPKGTYKVLFLGQPGGCFEYCLVNLATGIRINSSSIWDLLKSIENDLSANRFPQSAIQYRTWGSGASPAHKETLSTFTSARVDGGPQESQAGPTFIVRVLYRQNATWQGTIQWMEGRQTRQYRSVNELLNLMDDAAFSRMDGLEFFRDA